MKFEKNSLGLAYFVVLLLIIQCTSTWKNTVVTCWWDDLQGHISYPEKRKGLTPQMNVPLYFLVTLSHFSSAHFFSVFVIVISPPRGSLQQEYLLVWWKLDRLPQFRCGSTFYRTSWRWSRKLCLFSRAHTRLAHDSMWWHASFYLSSHPRGTPWHWASEVSVWYVSKPSYVRCLSISVWHPCGVGFILTVSE